MTEPKTKHYKIEKEDKESKEDMEDVEEVEQEDYYRGDGTYIKDSEQTKQEYGNTWD